MFGRIEQPYRRHREHSDGVDTGLDHRRKIGFGDRVLGKLLAMAALRKRAVGDAFDEVLLLSDKEELAVDANGIRRLGFRCPRSQRPPCNLFDLD